MKRIDLLDLPEDSRDLVRECEAQGARTVFERNGRPVAVLVSYDEYMALRETIEIANDPMSAEEALDMVNLGARLNHFPAQLSGGEQQRVAIARAIAKRPEVLLCAEPTGALDIKTGIVVLEALQRVNPELGTLTVVITHNAAMADMADRVIRFADGRVQSIHANASRAPASSLNW